MLHDPYGVIRSREIESADKAVRYSLMALERDNTVVSRSVSRYGGAGVQQVAIAVDNLIDMAAALRRRGAPLLPVPENYYDDLAAKYDLEPAFLDALRTSGVLYERGPQGEFLHAYVRRSRTASSSSSSSAAVATGSMDVAPYLDDEGQQVTPQRVFGYDTLVVAVGSLSNDFGTPGVREHAMRLETSADAQRFHSRLVSAVGRVNSQVAPVRPEQLAVAIIGAGATGVELAAELHRTTREVVAFGLDRVNAPTRP